MPVGLKNLYLRNIRNVTQKRNNLNLDDFQNVSINLTPDLINNSICITKKKIYINNIKFINNKLYLLK